MKNCEALSSHDYCPLPQVSDNDDKVRLQRCATHWCPKVTRLKVTVTGSLVLLTTSLVLLYSRHQPNLSLQNLNCCDIRNYTSAFPQYSFKNQARKETETFVEVVSDDDWPRHNLRAKHQKRRLPQCLLIGVRKGGTRALLEFMNIHPNIQAAHSEIHYFDNDENYNRGLDWYRKRMPYSYSDQITIEKSPSYFVEDGVPQRVYQMNASMKLLLIVRDPIDRAVSDYMQIVANKVSRNKTYQSFEEMSTHANGEINRSYNAIKRSVYHKFFKRWLSVFPREQFLIIDGENFIKHPLEELQAVENFLGLEHKILSDNIYFNKTRGFYCIQNMTSQKCLSASKGRKHPALSPDVARKLREFFRPLNQKFYNLVGRSFQWF